MGVSQVCVGDHVSGANFWVLFHMTKVIEVGHLYSVSSSFESQKRSMLSIRVEAIATGMEAIPIRFLLLRVTKSYEWTDS